MKFPEEKMISGLLAVKTKKFADKWWNVLNSVIDEALDDDIVYRAYMLYKFYLTEAIIERGFGYEFLCDLRLKAEIKKL